MILAKNVSIIKMIIGKTKNLIEQTKYQLYTTQTNSILTFTKIFQRKIKEG